MENAKKNCYDWLINKTKGVKIQMETKTNILFTGVMSALVSCVDEDGNVYERSMRRLMNDQMKAGLNGFYLCGGTGEGPVLQKETRMEIAEIARDEVKNGGSLIAHVGAIDLTTAVELAGSASMPFPPSRRSSFTMEKRRLRTIIRRCRTLPVCRF